MRNADGTLWPANAQLTAVADPVRYSPAIHVNQAGYVPAFAKRAMVGYYLGSLGELAVSPQPGFKLVDAQTGATVYQGALAARPDVGFADEPAPYQRVLEADFSSFTLAGQYQLVVPGVGASFPFRIDEGVAMCYARTYALGLYHQRCGTSNALPFTRFVHGPCHTAPAAVPSPQTGFGFTWYVLSAYATSLNPDNPPQLAPLLTNETAQLYPFVTQGAVDVSGGHHDAGDYSKYTINSAALIHHLVFAADAFPGATAAAPTSLELTALPLICSFTEKVHPPLFVEFCRAASDFNTTARTKFFCVNNSSGLPSPSTSAMLSHGCSITPPGGATSTSSKSLSGTCRSTFTFS